MNILDNLLLKFETDTNLRDFLMKKYVSKVPVVPDDDIPEHFDRWLGNLTDDEAMELLEEFEKEKTK